MKEHRLVLVIAVLMRLSGAAGGTSEAADISGTWSFSVDVGDSHGMPVFVFKQQGETLTGTIANGRGQQKITGTVRGDRAVFGFETTRDGKPFKGTYRGKIESPRQMTGTVDFSGALTGTGTWTATKK